MQNEKKNIKRENTLIGNLLRIGVIASVITVLTGILLGLLRKDLFTNGKLYEIHQSNENYFITFYHNLIAGKSIAFITLGLLFMLFTPIMRLLFALFNYLLEKDYLYVFITGLVLAILVLSIFLGASH